MSTSEICCLIPPTTIIVRRLVSLLSLSYGDQEGLKPKGVIFLGLASYVQITSVHPS